MMEWINDGATELPAGGEWRVVWRPAGDGDACVVSRFTVVRNRVGRYHVDTSWLFASGDWSHVEGGEGSYHDWETKREASTWARRMAEMEAANRSAVAWDGRVPS